MAKFCTTFSHSFALILFSLVAAQAAQRTITVRVDPIQIKRDRDELVAKVELKSTESIDLHSLSIRRIGDKAFPAHSQQKAKTDRPFRFYDADLLDEFPTWRRYASLEKIAGRQMFNMREKLPFGHRVFGAVGEHVRGTLVWPHTQMANAPSVYEISFSTTSQPPLSPPIGWIGDGGNRFAPTSPINGPPGNNSASVVDWNLDGLPDLIYGLSSGYVIVAENTGTREQPSFNRRRILYTSDGKPIDAGYDSSPLVTDWNGDGIRDLLIGAEKGCILYFRNDGSSHKPSFTFGGFIEADGKMLLTPNWPIAELPKSQPGDVYRADYLAIPCVCDWDGDGDSDLLAGGFVTGQIFYFENIGTKQDGTPNLESRGPLKADNQVLDVGWAAAPIAVDLDHDGDLDLVCGAKPMTADGGDVSDRNRNTAYFINTGSLNNPILKRSELPTTAQNPTGTTVMAPVADWTGDQLPDLFLVTRGSMLLYPIPNIGTRSQALFDMKQPYVKTSWNHQQIPSGTFIDWNGDGYPDLISRFHVSLNDGTGFPHSFTRRFSILAGKKPIRHPNKFGDENSHVTLHDLDGDGDHDCFYGAHSGHIWFHENRGTDIKPDIDTAGYRLQLKAGGFVRVGESPDGTNGFNFTVLQGARPKLAPADFNADGRADLVIGDTHGRVRYFRNLGRDKNGRHVFANPIMVHESRSRLSLHADDWDGDKVADLFVITGQRVILFRNRATPDLQFAPPERIHLPATIGGFYDVAPVDFNGDGDTDLVYQTSSRISCWVERSFLEHGYLDATIISAN